MKNKVVCDGDIFHCSYGTNLCCIKVSSQKKVKINKKLIATENDCTILNLQNFGMCTSLQNPQVASATAAANGVLTPQPCCPIFVRKWNTTTYTNILNGRILNADSTIQCSFSGNIKNISIVQNIVHS